MSQVLSLNAHLNLLQRYTFVEDASKPVTYAITVTLPVKDGLRVQAVPRVA
jgi:hypothetical protein